MTMTALNFDQKIDALLNSAKTIAVVGMSPKPERPSNRVAAYLIAQGYSVIPVNPGHREILGHTCYPELSAVPIKVDIVDIFRKASDIKPIVSQAIDIGARAVWMQSGIINREAASIAESAGLSVIMDRCIKVEHSRLLGR